MANQRPTKVLIPAAGLGTRFLPVTKAIPKEMLPIVDTPTIQLIVEEAVAAGIEDVVIVNGRHKEGIEEHFDHAFELETTLRARGKGELATLSSAIANMANIISVRQKEPLGLGHAVLSGRPAFGAGESVAVILGDDLIDNPHEPGIGQLFTNFENGECAVVGVMEVPEGEQNKYGIVGGDRDEKGIQVNTVVEKPAVADAPSRWAMIGRYLLPSDIWEILETVQPGHGGEIQLTDALAVYAQRGKLRAVPIRGQRYDAGDRVGYIHANLAYALKRPQLADSVRALMKSLLESE